MCHSKGCSHLAQVTALYIHTHTVPSSGFNVCYHPTTLLKKRINVLGGKREQEHSKGNKTVPGKVTTTRTEDGDK